LTLESHCLGLHIQGRNFDGQTHPVGPGLLNISRRIRLDLTGSHRQHKSKTSTSLNKDFCLGSGFEFRFKFHCPSFLTHNEHLHPEPRPENSSKSLRHSNQQHFYGRISALNSCLYRIPKSVRKYRTCLYKKFSTKIDIHVKTFRNINSPAGFLHLRLCVSLFPCVRSWQCGAEMFALLLMQT